MKNRFGKVVAKLWNQFIDILRDQGVKGESAHWYVMRAEHYLAAFPGQRLADHSAFSLTECFQLLGRKNQLKSWQFQQAVDAIQISLCQMVRLSWSDSFDWAKNVHQPESNPAYSEVP